MRLVISPQGAAEAKGSFTTSSGPAPEAALRTPGLSWMERGPGGRVLGQQPRSPPALEMTSCG